MKRAPKPRRRLRKGAFTVLTFNGGAPTAVVAGGSAIISDVVPCHIPAGATYSIGWLELRGGQS